MSQIPLGDQQTLAPSELTGEQLDDWRLYAGRLHARFVTRNFANGVALVNQVAEAAETADHHPDIDLRYSHVDVAMFSHDVHGITQRDVRLARVISEIAARLGATPDPSALKERRD